MIQLTKGTNVLDINLSDFSGAGQDVVQNGSFDDIGSDLILNGDFAEIGSDLVTNGDFSDVPLGSELVTYPNFTNSDLVQWKIASSRATKSWDASEFMRLTYDLAVGSALYATFGQTLNAYYNVKMRVRGTKADGVTAQGYAFGSIGDNGELGQVVSNPTLTSEWQDYEFNVWSTGTTFRFYLTTVAVGDLVDFDSISVKENINLVSNPNFTDGVEQLTQPIDLTVDFVGYTGGVIIDADSFSTDGTPSTEGIRNNAGTFDLVDGKSYKLVIAGTTTSSGFTIGNNQASGNEYGTGFGTHYFVASGTYPTTLWIRQQTAGTTDLTTFTIEELGADWILGTGWSVGDSKAICLADGNYNVLNQLSVLNSGSSYKVTYTADLSLITSGSLKLNTFSNSVTDRTVLDGTNTVYLTANGTSFQVNMGGAFGTATITNISVQELGEGWTLVGVNATNTISIESGGARVNSVDTNISLRQTILDIGKSYKLTCNTAITTGKLGLDSSTAGTTTNLIEGANVVYFKAVSETFSIKRVDAITNVLIDNITVQEVGQDWTAYASALGTSTVEFPSTGAELNIDALNSNVGIYQSGIFTLGKSYKIVLSMKATSAFDAEILESSGALLISTIGAVSLTTSYQTFTLYHLGTGTYDLFIHRLSTETLGASQTISIQSVIVQQLDTNDRWVTFADPDSKSVMKLGQVDLEIDTLGHDCGVYQTGLIKPNKLYIITINMKATAAINVEIAASLGTAVSAVIGTTLLTTSYVEYSFEYVTPFAVDHDLQIHRLFGTGADQTISIDYVSMNGVDESKWINDPTWNPFATSLVFVPTLTDESTNNSKQFTLFTAIAGGGWNGRSLHGQVIINNFPAEAPAVGIINLQQPDFLEGFYQVEIRGYLGTFYRILGKGMAHLERASTEDGYNRFEAYNDSVTYKAYEE